MRSVRLACSALLLVVLLGIVAGCGSETTTTTAASGTPATTAAGGGSDATATTTPTAAGGELAIGLISPLSGDMGQYGKMYLDAATFAADEINAAGGVNGQQIKLYAEDDRNSVEEATKAARKLIGVNKVAAITGMFSDTFLAVLPIAKQSGVFSSSNCAGTTRLNTTLGDMGFRTAASDDYSGKVIAQMFLDSGFNEIGMIYENDEARTSVAMKVKESLEAKGGKVLTEVTFNPKQTTYAAELEKLASADPKASYLGVAVESGATLLKDAAQAGYAWQWIGDADFAVPEIFELVGKENVEGIRVSTTAGDTSSQSWKDYVAAFNTKYGYEPTGAYVANMQDAMVIKALAMVKAGTNSGAGINQAYMDVANPPGDVVRTFAEGLAALKAGKDINYEGVTGPCDFDQYGNVSGSFQELIATDGVWVQGKQYPAGSIE